MQSQQLWATTSVPCTNYATPVHKKEKAMEEDTQVCKPQLSAITCVTLKFHDQLDNHVVRSAQSKVYR